MTRAAKRAKNRPPPAPRPNPITTTITTARLPLHGLPCLPGPHAIRRGNPGAGGGRQEAEVRPGRHEAGVWLQETQGPEGPGLGKADEPRQPPPLLAVRRHDGSASERFDPLPVSE